MANKFSQSTLNLFPTQTLASHTHTHTHNQLQCPAILRAASTTDSSSYTPPEQNCLEERGLVAQVFPIEMQTLWYGNWQLQKPARIHTSMHWNHLRNVRWDGTSSQDKTDKWTKPARLGRVRDGVEVQRERERERVEGVATEHLSSLCLWILTIHCAAVCF